jgi:stage II sporulation SpoAA-like protein
MSIQQNMHFQSGLLSVDASGEFSLEDAKQAFLELLKAIAHYQAEKILLDGRNMKGKPGDLERFYYGEFAARETHKLVVEHKIVPRFAYVIHEPLRDPTRLGETVAVNRGMNVKTFETAEDAIEWLTDVH